MSSPNDWPAPSDFLAAMQNPQYTFADRELRTAQVQRRKNGRPWPRSGANATVYKLELPGGGAVAVRVFHSRRKENHATRWLILDEHLRRARLDGLVGFSYQPQGLQINGSFYPILTMEWVEGETLGLWMSKVVARKDNAALRSMAERWVELMGSLQKAQIAHGDLQHGNVMVINDRPILVDYDGMCVPDLLARPDLYDPARCRSKDEAIEVECGLPAYQHPERMKGRVLSLDLDHFSAWIILIALRATAADLGLYAKYVEATGNENLLFQSEDIEAPTRSELWADLVRSPDSEVREWSERLRKSLDEPFDRIPKFELDPFKALRILAGASPPDWGAIAAEAGRVVGPNRPLPSDLKTRVEEAGRRVAARGCLQAALGGGDPRRVATAFDPQALAGWPAAADDVRKAVAAIAQVGHLDRLRSAMGAGDPAAFLDLWDRTASAVAGVAEAKTYKAEADRLRAEAARQKEVQAALDQLAAAIARDGPEGAIVGAWAKVEGLGLSTDKRAAPHRSRTELARSRAERLGELAAVPAGATEENDRRAVAAWDEQLLGPCAEAAPYRPRHQSAAARLAGLKAVEEVAAGSDGSPEAEALVVQAAEDAGLPPGYSPRIEARIRSADALGRLDEAIRSGSESAIDDAWRKAKDAGVAVANPSVAQRAELAGRRLAAMQRLDRIATGVGLDVQDTEWIAAWDDDLLGDCHDAEGYRKRHKQAVRRRRIVDELEAALASRDTIYANQLKQVMSEIRDYPSYSVLMPKVEELVREVEQVEQLCRALDTGDDDAIRRQLTLEILRVYPQAFAGHRQSIERFVGRELQGFPLRAPVRPAVERSGAIPRVRLLWDWPATPLVTACRVASGTTGYPLTGRGRVASVLVDKPNYVRGGGFRLALPPKTPNLFVVVWPVVDLGWTEISGKELRLPPITGSGAGNGTGGGWRA